MALAISMNDRSVNTCNDICVSEANSAGVTCQSATEIYAVQNSVININLQNMFQGTNTKQKKAASGIGYHHGLKRSH